MYRNSALNVLRKYASKIVAVVLIVTLMSWGSNAYFFWNTANAGTPSPAKITINNSQSGASGVTYTVAFTATTNTAIQYLKVQFCSESTLTGTCTKPTGMVTTGASRVSDNISTTSPSSDFSTDGTLIRSSNDTTVQSPLAVIYTATGITNPTTANSTFYARITTYSDNPGTVEIDSTVVALAVLSSGSIAVTATVDPNFTFTVTRAVTGRVNNGYSASDLINVSSTTNSSIPFGDLNTTTASVAAHDVTITTNASNGYLVTASNSATAVTGNPPLVASNNSDHIDSFVGVGTNAVPAAWSAPAGSVANSDTGYFAYTTDEESLCGGTANRFTDDSSYQRYAGPTTTGGAVACSTSPVSSETTRVGWKLGINSIQPAGSYSGTVILVATPTY